VREFAVQTSRILNPEGILLIQVINYDRILDQKLDGLPAIENDDIRFERKYVYPENPTHVQFKTRLTLKSSGGIIENEVPLLAIRPPKLRQILEDCGFCDLEEFGSFQKDIFSSQSQPYIVRARITRRN
jgi:glycine/sarcosine N-methyltransferase